jgi:hypothetical protein
MAVLMSLMCLCLQRVCVLFFGVHRPLVLIQSVQRTTEIEAYYLPSPIARLHAPIPKLTV